MALTTRPASAGTVYAGVLDDEPPHALNEISETAKADVARGRRKLISEIYK
jgi:hypothetical protein